MRDRDYKPEEVIDAGWEMGDVVFRVNEPSIKIGSMHTNGA